MTTKKSAAVLAVLILTAGPAAAASFGAIAFDPKSGSFGASVHATKEAAEQGATKECKSNGGGEDCDRTVWVEDRCMSLSAENEEAWGIGLSHTDNGAKEEAVKICVKNGGEKEKCEIAVTFCAR